MALRKIDLMHKMFGAIPNRTCNECCHLTKHRRSRNYYKCECYGETQSEASDWRLKYQACGLINLPYWQSPLMKLARASAKPMTQIAGQIEMEINNEPNKL